MSSASAIIRTLEQLEHGAARTLVGLTARAPAALLERFARVIDGDRLHPEIQLLLALHALTANEGLSTDNPQLARARMRRDARVHAGPPIAVGAVRDLTIDGPAGRLRARHYVPPRAQLGPARPLLVFFHGGGFVVGDLDTHDAPCRALCRDLDVHVLSGEYRLAPEHPFPAAIDDARAVLRYAQAQAARLGADPTRIAIGGDSAGANLATVVTQLAARDGDPLPSLQLLIYPAVDSSKDWPSIDLFADGYFLTRGNIHGFRRHYFAGFDDLTDPRASPLLAKDLGGLPPAVIVTAAFDPLRDEGEAYARALEAAGVRTKLYRATGLIHGFINLGAISGSAQQALRHVSHLAREFL
jgi:acetyl esterase